MKFRGSKNLTEVKHKVYQKNLHGYRIDRWHKVTGIYGLSKHITNLIDYGTITSENSDDIILLVKQMFIRDGRSEEEAMMYLNSNKSLLLLNRQNILSKLAILDIIGLSREVFFEHNEYLFDNYALDAIYSAVKALQAKPYEVSFNDFALLMYLKEDNSEYTLSEKKSRFLAKSYENNLLKSKDVKDGEELLLKK